MLTGYTIKTIVKKLNSIDTVSRKNKKFISMLVWK